MASIRDLMTAYYKAGSSGDWSTWLSLLDDNIIVDEQLAGRLEGIDAMKTLSERVKASYTKFNMQPQHMVVEGDEVCTGWKLEATNTNGAQINATGANFCRFENGKIVYMTNFHDTVPFKGDTAYQTS